MDVIIASLILDRVLLHCAVVNTTGERCQLKARKAYISQAQYIVNTLLAHENKALSLCN